jgi:heme exporter protein C
MVIATGLVFLYAPLERTMGEVQRIFYFHVASAWIGLFAFFVTLVVSVIYLRTNNALWDRIGVALIYVAYLMLRQGIDDPNRRTRFAAVYGIFGFLSVPITFFAIRFWRTIHPVVVGNGGEQAQGSFAMAQPMVITLLFCVATFTVLYVCLLANRLQLEQLSERVEQLKVRALSA